MRDLCRRSTRYSPRISLTNVRNSPDVEELERERERVRNPRSPEALALHTDLTHSEPTLKRRVRSWGMRVSTNQSTVYDS